jgi:tetratricopeptide (TPR) repeat protein
VAPEALVPIGHETVRLLHEWGDTATLVTALAQLTDIHLAAGNGWLALEAALVAARLAARLNDAVSQVRALSLLGLCYGLAGDVDNADRLAIEAFQLAQQHGHVNMPRACLAINRLLMGCLAADQLRRVARQADAHHALWRLQPVVDEGLPETGTAPLHWALWRSNRAGWLRRVGRPDAAEADARFALQQALAQGWHDMQRHAWVNLGHVALSRRQPEQARQAFEACLAVAGGADLYGFVSDARQSLARLLDMRHERGAAERLRQQEAEAVMLQFDRRRPRRGDLARADFDVRQAVSTAEREQLDAELQRLHRLLAA